MSWYGDPYGPRRKKRTPKDGIRARSQRGQIGETWWSRRFIEVLESWQMGARLTRGRSYARSGQVMDLEVEPGKVSARVQGSRPRPYQVVLAVRPFGEPDWGRVEEALSTQALFAARLLAGEIPAELEGEFRDLGLSLFPATGGEVKTSCSCPDWANPCKHIAATLYILAERFDEDPFLILAWRGRPRDVLLARLRELRGALPSGSPGEEAGPGGAEAGGGEPLEASLADFWRARPLPPGDVGPPGRGEVPDALLRQLGPSGVKVGGRDATEWLSPLYAAMSAAAWRRLEGADPE